MLEAASLARSGGALLAALKSYRCLSIRTDQDGRRSRSGGCHCLLVMLPLKRAWGELKLLAEHLDFLALDEEKKAL